MIQNDLFHTPRITMTGIPLEAYDYVVNGKPAPFYDDIHHYQCIIKILNETGRIMAEIELPMEQAQ